MNTFWEGIYALWAAHKGKIVGGVCGFILAVLMLVIGFWKTMLILLLVSLGATIGSQVDDREQLLRWLDRILKRGKD